MKSGSKEADRQTVMANENISTKLFKCGLVCSQISRAKYGSLLKAYFL